MKKVLLLVMVCAVAGFIGRCSVAPLAGGGTESTNGKIIGTLKEDDGKPATHTKVMLVASLYDPAKDGPVPDSMTGMTDSLGAFAFAKINTGDYAIIAIHGETRKSAVIRDVQVHEDRTDTLTADTLRAPGSIRVMLPPNANTVNGYLYIPGTLTFAFLKSGSGFVMLDSVPAGKAADITYSTLTASIIAVLRHGVQVKSGDTAVVWNFGWNYARKITLNTSSSGAGVAGNVSNFPVLVRLTAGNFDFTQARNNGEDIRFTKQDNAFLPYEIERWDAIGKHAELWVKMDTVHGNDSAQSITMYWGNIDAATQSNSAAVFDTAAGFQGVWHLSEAGNAMVKDATGNHYDGTVSDTAPAGAEGTIGPCRSFNGSSNCIRMNGTAESKLNFQENGIYMISAWAYADTLDIGYHVIAGKNNEQYFLGLKRSNPDTTMRWEFVEYHAKAGWQITQDFPSAKTWTYLVGVREGNAQYLYVNGALVDSATVVTPNTASRNTGDDVTIGRFLSLPTYTYEGKCPFLGKIDEVRILNAAPGADWVKLCYMNQKGYDALVKW